MSHSPTPAFDPYRDHPSAAFEQGGRGSPAADYELQDYYDDANFPAPHRLSGVLHGSSPYPSNQSLPDSGSPRHSGLYDPPDRGASSSPYSAAAPAAAASTAAVMPSFSRPRNYERDYTTPGDVPAERGWGEKSTGSNRKRYIIIGAIVGVIGLIIVGVAVGVTVSHKNKSSNSSSTSNGVVKQTDPNDPSTFVKDSRFKQSFYGLAYTPANSQLPSCGNSLSDVITDIQIMSQLTKRLRLYGADCNQTALVLEAIKQTKVDMQVFVGNYPVATDSNAAYDRQRDTLKDALSTYGTSNIAGMTVGNEFMLNYLNANGATDPNSAVGNQGAQLLIADITDTKSTFSSINGSMPIGTSDAGSYFNNEVLEAVSYGMSNVHPWFANQSIDDAAGWTYTFFETQNVQPASQLSNQPKMYIAETGWPTNATDPGSGSDGPSTASEANLQKFLDTFVCQANTNGTGYFYFETFDEPWKTTQFGGVEGYWGMFYSNKTLKNINIPDCPIS